MKRVLDDIVKSLKLSDPCIFKSDFARKNLHLEVRFKGIDNDPTADVLKLLKNIYTSRRKRLGNRSEERIQGVCGIIYCSTRAQCDLVTEALKANKINAASYHAGLTQKQRNLILSSWSKTTTVKKNFQQKTLNQINSIDESKDPTKPCDEIIDIVVATISFGMGIDKACVRFVIHWDMPKTIEGYYQESGRAGRDGKTSRCILYYSKSDCDRILYLQSQQSKNRAHKFNEQQSFDKVILH
jgi:superfamily II DNA helicase RecQ